MKKRKPKRIVSVEGEEKEGKISDEIETVARLTGWLVGWLYNDNVILKR